VWDTAFPYSSWVPQEYDQIPNFRDTSAKLNTCVFNNLRWLLRFITVRVAQFRGQGRDGIDVLVILPKAAKEVLTAWWAQLGGLPAGLALEHWNAIRGLDAYGGVRCAILVSRPLPTMAELEVTAWTLSGVVGTQVPYGLLPQTEAAYRMRDGSGRRAMVARHPDPIAESVRRSVCDNEVLQGDGRPRGARRTEDQPLLTELLFNLALPIDIAELIPKAALNPDATIARWLLAQWRLPRS
jgi:putative DNA primase/helicase